MHELSICQSLIAEVERIAGEHQATSVEKIVLRVGPLSGVEKPLLARAFPLARAGTIAEAAVLVTEGSPVRIRCPDCGAENQVPTHRLLCPDCGGWQTQLIGGNELILASVEFNCQPVEDR